MYTHLGLQTSAAHALLTTEHHIAPRLQTAVTFRFTAGVQEIYGCLSTKPENIVRKYFRVNLWTSCEKYAK